MKKTKKFSLTAGQRIRALAALSVLLVGAILYGALGIQIEKDGIRFAPCVPDVLADALLENLKVREMTLTIKVEGSGNTLTKFLVDGIESEPFIAWDDKVHVITLVME